MKVSCLCPIIMCFCLHETAHPGNMSDDGETKPMEAESEDRPAAAEHDLEEYLEGASCFKSFEDVEDEVHYLRHRGDALARGLLEAREEIARLHEAGHRLQKAYESLHQQFREVSADAVYWQSLAEARVASEKTQACNPIASFQEPGLSAIAESGSPTCVTPRDSVNPTAVEVEVASGPASPVNLDPREALRRAAVEAAEVLQKRGASRKKKVDAPSPHLSKGLPTTSPSKHRSRDFESMMARTPPRRTRTDTEGSPSPCTPGLRALSSALSGGFLSRPSLSSRKWGIGSSPKRCPGLGTPTRRGKVDADFLARSPLRQ
eukprot:s484_g11.t1